MQCRTLQSGCRHDGWAGSTDVWEAALYAGSSAVVMNSTGADVWMETDGTAWTRWEAQGREEDGAQRSVDGALGN